MRISEKKKSNQTKSKMHCERVLITLTYNINHLITKLKILFNSIQFLVLVPFFFASIYIYDIRIFITQI